jgi:beta-fructofuranosidase
VKANPDALNYPAGCESLSLAFPVTQSTGPTLWTKYPANPILPSAPASNVTAWRDPYVREWKALDKARGKEPGEVLYGIISGGYKDVGSALFLYEIDKQNIEDWKYLGDFGSASLCWSKDGPSGRWAADTRDIFEVANFVTLKTMVRHPDGQIREEEREFFLMSAAAVSTEDTTKFTPPQRPARQEIFVSGSLNTGSDGTVHFQPKCSGYVDRGNYYAMNTFYDHTREVVVAHAWVTEDDVSHQKRHEQGWSGCLALPRTITLKAIHGISGCLGNRLQDIASIELLPASSDTTHTVLCLNVEPCEDVVQQLKERAEKQQAWDEISIDGAVKSAGGNILILGRVPSHTAIIHASIRVAEKEAGLIVLRLRHDRDLSISTSVIIDVLSGTITLDRVKSVASEEAKYYDTRAEVVPYALFYRRIDNGETALEDVDLTVILDHGVIEVFANGRTAVTTRIYTGHKEGCDHVSLELGGHRAKSVEMWQGLSCTLEYV